MTSYKLGRRPPSNAPALRFAQFWTGVTPARPAAADFLGQREFGLYRNDEFGDCGPTSVANFYRLVSYVAGHYYEPTQDEVFDLYRRSGNPNFNPETGADDNGVIMQDMLNALLESGIGGRKPIAFAKIDPSNDDQLEAAVAIFGGVLWGVDLETAQQHQTDLGYWDYSRSGEWGGHAILCGAYANDQQDVISWGKRIRTLDAFRRHQLEEVWVVIWPEHLEHPNFQEGVNIAALADAYKQLTGKTLPLPVTPPVTPPGGGGAGSPSFLDEAVATRVERAAKRLHMTPEQWINRHLKVYFGIH
jgi:hypothetical protein